MLRYHITLERPSYISYNGNNFEQSHGNGVLIHISNTCHFLFAKMRPLWNRKYLDLTPPSGQTQNEWTLLLPTELGAESMTNDI